MNYLGKFMYVVVQIITILKKHNSRTQQQSMMLAPT